MSSTINFIDYFSQEAEDYEDSLKSYRDLKNSLDTAFEEGKLEGLEFVVLNGLKKGISLELLSELTGFSIEELTALKAKLDQ